MKKEIRIADGNSAPTSCGSVWLTDEPRTALSLREAGACVLFLLTPENADAELPGIEWCVQVDGGLPGSPEAEAGSEAGNCLEAADSADAEAILEALGLSRDFLKKVWQRHAGLPWQIAETGRLRLRELTAEDAAAVRALWEPAAENAGDFRALQEPAAEDAGDARVLWEREGLEAYIRHMYGFYGFGLWAVECREEIGTGKTGRIIGLAGLQMREGREEPELGFCIAPAFRGRGYALEACRAVLRCGFQELELSAVRAAVRRDNEASLRLCEKLGFLPETDDARKAAAPPDLEELRLTRDRWETAGCQE